MNYHTSRRMEQAVLKLANEFGLDGNLFADSIPQTGTYEQEMSIIALRLDVRPRPRTESERLFVEQLARSVVMSSSSDLAPRPVKTMEGAVSDYIASELEGEEIPAARYHWHKPRRTPARIERARRNAQCG